MASLHSSRRPTFQRASHTRSITRKAVCVRASASSETTGLTRAALSSEDLIARAREFVTTGSGFFTPPRPELFSDEFVFRGPIIGPLTKKDYFNTLGTFKMYETFPDLQSNSYGYCVDPSEPLRVRFFVRETGTCTGTVKVLSPMELPPTNQKAFVATEAQSILFDEEGKVKLLNVGYCVDYDAPGSNAGMLSAAFGLLAGAGITLPMGKVLSSSQWFITQMQNVGVLESPRAVSKWEEVPQWYKNYCPRREGAEGAPGQ